MSRDEEKTALCRHCLTRTLATDRKSADILCVACGEIWGKWSPEFCGDTDPARTVYHRSGYFETVLNNQVGYDCIAFSANDLATVRRAAPRTRADEWDVGKVRAITRRLKMKRLTKSAGRMAHALRYGVTAKFPRLHHLEREAMSAMFSHVAAVFERLKAKGRKNLVSYSFVMGKLLEEVGRLEDFRHLIVPIKTKGKRLFADRVWEEVLATAPWRGKPWRTDNCGVAEYLSAEAAL